jgi:hypothetical protein
MAKGKTRQKSTDKSGALPAGENTCFVISPIGKEGTQEHSKFKDVFEYIIKKAVKESGYELRVARADDINRTGSFIKDILENIHSSFVVIADLTGQNPNVFYELGVRHCLAPRTILIAQSLDDIPTDLREYRTIVYDTSAKGATQFQTRLSAYLEEIYKEPNRPDNPVLDRLSGVIDNRIALLERENYDLKQQLSKVLQTGVKEAGLKPSVSVRQRIQRILKLKNAEEQILSGSFLRGEQSFSLPASQGNFRLYFLQKGTAILDMWYVSVHASTFDLFDDLSDVRVLMENCSQGQSSKCNFIIVTEQDLSGLAPKLFGAFEKMKQKLPKESRQLFKLLLWDKEGLEVVEKELALRVDT